MFLLYSINNVGWEGFRKILTLGSGKETVSLLHKNKSYRNNKFLYIAENVFQMFFKYSLIFSGFHW